MKLLSKFSLLALVLMVSYSCKKKSASAVTGEATEVKTVAGDDYTVDGVASKIMWSGSKVAGTHTGTLNVSNGKVKVNNGKVTGGSFTIDMASLTDTDLEAGQGKEKLEGHLKSPDFFDVATYPTAKFDITKIAGLANDENGNTLVYGNLTLKDVSKEVAFKANVNVSGDVVTVTCPVFNINRTDFGIKYGSASFMDVVKDKAINDQVGLSINLIANK